MSIAYFHMDGKALTWYHWQMDFGLVGSWDEFVATLKVRFTPSAFDDLVGSFIKLKQTLTVEEYQSQSKIQSNRIIGLSEEFRVNKFLSGLKEELRIMVTMLRPTTLLATFGLP